VGWTLHPKLEKVTWIIPSDSDWHLPHLDTIPRSTIKWDGGFHLESPLRLYRRMGSGHIFRFGLRQYNTSQAIHLRVVFIGSVTILRLDSWLSSNLPTWPCHAPKEGCSLQIPGEKFSIMIQCQMFKLAESFKLNIWRFFLGFHIFMKQCLIWWWYWRQNAAPRRLVQV